YAFLGVEGKMVDGGIKLSKIWPDQPAAAAGMREGDVLLTFQGVPVPTMERLQELVAEEEPGRRVRVTVRRDGEVHEIRLRLGAREQ
ncbi:MAG: PDZ domain-containing protein, partial [Planctomycetaceae bacterium]|nr:PDZ domain-containing protein [Planctomycetaceae bacterium]